MAVALRRILLLLLTVLGLSACASTAFTPDPLNAPQDLRDVQVRTVSYPVGDLVIPIPNFVATSNMGLAGAYSGFPGRPCDSGAGLHPSACADACSRQYA